jgi:membrane-associated phospholipid phosphatase
MLVGLSRIHLQVHFPSDVIVGMLAAALLVLALRELPPWRGEAA